jgi:hypothetical protein
LYAEFGEFCDEYDLSDSWKKTKKIKFDVVLEIKKRDKSQFSIRLQSDWARLEHLLPPLGRLGSCRFQPFNTFQPFQSLKA